MYKSLSENKMQIKKQNKSNRPRDTILKNNDEIKSSYNRFYCTFIAHCAVLFKCLCVCRSRGRSGILTGCVTVHTEAVPPHVSYGLDDHRVTLAA